MFKIKYALGSALIGLMICVMASNSLSVATFRVQAADAPGTAEMFAAKGGVTAGLLFDGRGNMYVGANNCLVRIRPDGSSATICDLNDLPLGKDYYYASPMIWDMVLDKDGNIIAAAQDRILKITPEGSVTTLIREDFIGFAGASGLAIDRRQNLYVASGNKVIRYSPDLKPEIYIDGKKGIGKNQSFFSLDFDPEFKNLYLSDFNNQTLIRYPIDTDGKPGQPELLAEFKRSSPLNIVFGAKGNIYVSLDITSTLLKIGPDGKQETIEMGKGANHILAFGGEGFDKQSIYFTTLNGSIFRFPVGEEERK